MKVPAVSRSRANLSLLPTILLIAIASAAYAAEPRQVILSRDSKIEGEIKGLVDVVISPGFDDARVSVSMDGQKIANEVIAPHRIPIDFGPQPVEHKISVTA